MNSAYEVQAALLVRNLRMTTRGHRASEISHVRHHGVEGPIWRQGGEINFFVRAKSQSS
jgi:hypothetical protein